MGLSRLLIEQKVDDYEDPIFNEEVERLQTLPEQFADGSWSIKDLEWVIEWKVGRAFVKPTLRHLRSNSEDAIRDAIETAVTASAIRDKVAALTSLKGIGVPVASAIMLFIDPDQYTVIDVRAWRALRSMGHLDQELPDVPTIEEYLIYLGACWTLANEYDVSLRTLDRALWAIGGED